MNELLDMCVTNKVIKKLYVNEQIWISIILSAYKHSMHETNG